VGGSSDSAIVRPDPRDDLSAILKWALLGTAAGALAGGLIGGVGGRVAMFALRLTSPDSVNGVTSDDGFVIGQFSLDTGFLLFLTAVAGAANGLAFVSARPFLPPRVRVPGWTVAGGLVGGSFIVHPDGVDFTLLDPLWLAVLLFVIIPAAGAGATAALVERWSSDWWWRDRRRTVIASLPAVAALVFWPLLLVAVAGTLLVLVAGRSSAIRAVASAESTKGAGTAVLAMVVVLGGVALISDIRQVFA
jgi:hypothetical protein